MLYQWIFSINQCNLLVIFIFFKAALPIHVYARSCHDLHPICLIAITLGDVKKKPLEKRI